MRFAYLGTDAFAASVLERLSAAGRVPSLVVTKPDSRQGRGQRTAPPPTAVIAAELGIQLTQPDPADPGRLIEEIEAIDPDFACLCAYGAIIREPLLSKYVILNLHPSLLPRWRGAAPIERALMAGDERTGVSIIRLVEELDAGPVALAESVGIDPDADFAALSATLQSAGARLLAEAIDRFGEGTLEFHDQATDGVTYAERIDSGDRFIDTAGSAEAMERKIRALHPHIGARLRLGDGSVIGVRRAELASEDIPEGEVRAGGDVLLVGCAEGTLAVSTLVPPGGREMPTAAWLRGRPRIT